jgi:hypothetical protein
MDTAGYLLIKAGSTAYQDPGGVSRVAMWPITSTDRRSPPRARDAWLRSTPSASSRIEVRRLADLALRATMGGYFFATEGSDHEVEGHGFLDGLAGRFLAEDELRLRVQDLLTAFARLDLYVELSGPFRVLGQISFRVSFALLVVSACRRSERHGDWSIRIRRASPFAVLVSDAVALPPSASFGSVLLIS